MNLKDVQINCRGDQAKDLIDMLEQLPEQVFTKSQAISIEPQWRSEGIPLLQADFYENRCRIKPLGRAQIKLSRLATPSEATQAELRGSYFKFNYRNYLYEIAIY